MSGVRNSRNPSDCSVLTHSDNRAYLATVLRTFAQIPACGSELQIRSGDVSRHFLYPISNLIKRGVL